MEQVKNNQVGRPLKFKSVKELESKIKDYIVESKKNKIPLTVTGLCLALETTRQTLRDYESRLEFAEIIQKAKLSIENDIVVGLLTGKYNATGAIFNLKNNFGWVDKRGIDHNGLSDNKPGHFSDVVEKIKNMSTAERARFISSRLVAQFDNER